MRCVAMISLLAACVAVLPLPLSAQTATNRSTQAPSPGALAVYEEGKKLYDAGDYLAARSKFIQAARLDPENPRWYYNLGLVHRQLDNYQAARQSFLRARELNPDYKKAEIDAKLSTMGFDPADAAEQAPSLNSVRESAPEAEGADDSAFIVGVVGLLLAGAGFVVYRRRRNRTQPAGRKTAAPAAQPIDPAQLAAEAERLDAAGLQLSRVEHALRLGEDPDLRARLEYACRIETVAREMLQAIRLGDAGIFARLTKAVDDTVNAAGKAEALALQVHGEQAFAGQGKRVGCFFCAKPLANPNAGRPLNLQGQGLAPTRVLACPECETKVSHGAVPAVRTGPDGQTHWSELPDYDPYRERHADTASWQDVPAWRYQPRQPMGDLARLAGGALLGVGASSALAATSLLDLDAAQQAALAQEATEASARKLSEARASSSFADHS